MNVLPSGETGAAMSKPHRYWPSRGLSSNPRASSILLAVSVASCGIFGPSDVRSLAYLGLYGAPIRVTVPDTVSRNTDFSVEIVYWGSRYCTELDEVEVVLSGSIVTLRPYVKNHSGVCDSALWGHTVQQVLTFAAPGAAEVRVIGWIGEIGATGRTVQRDTTVVRPITVR